MQNKYTSVGLDRRPQNLYDVTGKGKMKIKANFKKT